MKVKIGKIKEKLLKNLKSLEHWTLFISILAFLFSIINWIDLRWQSKLFAGQVRAYVQVVEIKLVEPINDASFIKLQLKLKNFGQTAAMNVKGEMDYQVGIPDSEGKGNVATRRNFYSMGPGLERIVILQSNRINRRDWPSPSLRGLNSVYFYGTIWFTDATTNEESKEDWCYELKLKTEDDFKKTDLEMSEILTYHSK